MSPTQPKAKPKAKPKAGCFGSNVATPKCSVTPESLSPNSKTKSARLGPLKFLSTSDNQDRMLTHGTLTFSHNQNGERTQKSDSSSSPAAVTNYTYDSVGSLIRVDLPSSDYVEYLYDAFDRRSVRKVNGSVSRYYVYQSDLQIAAEYDSSYNLVARYVYASQSHVPDYVVKSGINYRIVTDHLGSVRLVVRADTGAIAQAISYDEFGRVLSDSNPGFQAFGFAGGLYDHQTSLVRFGARDYDPETGRWLSKDPILFAGGDTNLYGYVLQDPVNLVDPSGLCPWCVAAGIGAVVSGGIDLGFQLANNGGNMGAIDWGSVGTSALAGAAFSALGPTGGLLGRGGQRAAQFGYGRSAGLLNSGATRFGWSGPAGGLDVLSLRLGGRHFDLGWLGSAASGANPWRDGVVSGILGAGAANGGMCE